MTLALILVIVALLAAIGFRQAVRGFAADITDPEQLLGRTHPVDLLAFGNLIDPDQDDYLRANLPWYWFLRVRRARYRAAGEYVQMAAANAAIMIRLGHSAKHSSDLRIREAGKELLTLAVETRILAGATLLQLYVARLLPWWQPSLASITMAYTGMRTTLDRVVRWQRPELAGRISARV